MELSKRKRSNEQRLKAVQEKKAKLEARYLTINASGVTSTGQRIVFSSDSEGSSTENVERAQRLKLFENDSSESESERERLNLKTKFDGRRGEKLFQLQRKIGHDRRFRVDERFLEEEDEQVECNGSKEAEDELGQQIQREKASSLKIIDSLLGGGCGPRSQLRDREKSIQHTSDTTGYPLLPLRYDPSSATCTELELEYKPDSPLPRDSSDKEPSDDGTPSPLPEVVSTERYYNVSGNLKELFTSSCDEFTFLTDSRDDDSGNESTDHSEPPRTTSTSTPNWVSTLSKLSSRAEDKSEHITGEGINQADSTEPAALTGTKLFFHSCTPSLRNRLDENNFYCSQPLSELKAGWPQRRTIMKQSFRKRRKDAIKLSRKKRKQIRDVD